jgi:hypothetical protein
VGKTVYFIQLFFGMVLLVCFLFDTIDRGTYRFVDLQREGGLEEDLIFTDINDVETNGVLSIDKFILILGESPSPYMFLVMLFYLIVVSFVFVKQRLQR